jgi:hypothetical protein
MRAKIRQAYARFQTDLLFTEGSRGGLLRGVMVLSTYPLLTIEPDWTSSLLAPRKRAYTTFAVGTGEGV